MHNIYVASSWKNVHQPKIVDILRLEGHYVYDFREHGFSWASVDPNWENWTTEEYQEALKHPLAKAGFTRDALAMLNADTCVLVTPSGNSAHIEAGWFVGRPDKQLIIFMHEVERADLMYNLADHIVFTYKDVVARLRN